MKMCRLGLLVAAGCLASCGSSLHPCFADCHAPLAATYRPDPDAPSMVVTVRPTAEWTDAGLTVHKGDQLLLTASGQVHWQARNLTTGPDGDRGLPGWSVGPGGLQARVGVGGKPFDVGARTGLFPDKHARPPHHPLPPPPMTMPRDGALQLGFKHFAPGANTGAFDVAIRRAVAVSR